MPPGKSSALFLIAGADLQVSIHDERIASCREGKPQPWATAAANLSAWERSQDVRSLMISGVMLGQTVLRARLADGRDWIAPLSINVVPDPEYRAGGETVVGNPLGNEMRTAASFRDALVLLAKDQMWSALGRSPTGGDGRYGLSAGTNWCGAFVHWLYVRTAATRGVVNPFGTDVNTLASPQKAIGWALHNPTLADIIRFEGSDPYGWSWGPVVRADQRALHQDFVDIDASHPVQAGDIALHRITDSPQDGWKHVCMVLDPPTATKSDFTTIDGNQTGAFRADGGTSNECIGVNSHDANDRLPDGRSYKWVFLHMKTV